MKRICLHTWNFLVILLVVFPLLTGGVWISRPGLFLELSDLAVPTLIVSLLGIILLTAAGVPLAESFCVRSWAKLWNGWVRALEMRPNRTLGWGAFLNGSIWLVGSIKRYLEVNQHQMDLTIFVNTIWNFTHGHGYFSSAKGGINLLLDHQSPILMAFGPAFALFPSPVTLLTLQAFAVSSGAFAAYWIARQVHSELKGQASDRSRWLMYATPLLYWCYLPVRNAVGFDFHPETVMLPLFLFAIWGCQSARLSTRILGCVLLLPALACKESAPVVLMGIALSWTLGAGPEQSRKFTRGLGLVLILVSAAVFWLDTQWIPHALGGSSYVYQDEYAELGRSFWIVFSPITHPHEFWARVLRASRFRFLLWTLGPLALLPLLHPRRFLAAIPPYLMLFLSRGDVRVHIGFHYGIESAVGLFWALPGLTPYFSRKALGAWSLFCALTLFGRSEIARIRFYNVSDHARWLMKDFIPCLNPNVPLSASVALSPHVATRYWISFFPEIRTSSGFVSCIVYDPGILNMGSPWRPEDILSGALSKDGFHEAFHCAEGIEVLERQGESCLRCTPQCE